jgi:hypothetical protein
MLTASFSAQDPEAGLVCSSSSAVIELMIRFTRTAGMVDRGS